MNIVWPSMLPRPGPGMSCKLSLFTRIAAVTLILLLTAAMTGCGTQETKPVAETPEIGEQTKSDTEPRQEQESGEAVQDEEKYTGEPEVEQWTEKGFSDIAGHPAEAYILEGLERNLFTVPMDGLYRPDDDATCGEFAVALWRLAGCPGGEKNTLSSQDEIEMQTAVSWVFESGYCESGSFVADHAITRLQAMEILFNFNGRTMGMEALLTGVYDDAFTDSGDIPDGGKAPLYWGFFNVLIREPEPQQVAPFGTVTRGDMAECLVRFMRNFRSEPADN